MEYWPEAVALNGDALRELERLAIAHKIMGSISIAMIRGTRTSDADILSKNKNRLSSSCNWNQMNLSEVK